MRMRTTTAAILAVSLAGALLAAPVAVRAAGEGPEAFRPGLAVLRSLRDGIHALDLSSEQKTRIREILRGRKHELREAHDRAFTAKQAVQDAIHQDTVDEALIRQRVQEAAEAAADVAVLHAHLRADVRAVLTAEQRRTADAQRARFRALIGRVRAAVRAFVDESVAGS